MRLTPLSQTRDVIGPIPRFVCQLKATEDRWQTALDAVMAQFEIDDLTEKVNSLKSFLWETLFFVNLPTAYGKSFHCLPMAIVADVLQNKQRGLFFIFYFIQHQESITIVSPKPEALNGLGSAEKKVLYIFVN